MAQTKCKWCGNPADTTTYREIDECTGSSPECWGCECTSTKNLIAKYRNYGIKTR